MDVTVVSGVPGVGASRVCQEARSRLGEGYTLLNFGDVMLERAVARDRDLGADRDDLATLPRREIRLLQRRAAEFVAATARSQAVILDTHLAVATAHGFLTGMPDAVLADVDPARFVLVEAGSDRKMRSVRALHRFCCLFAECISYRVDEAREIEVYADFLL